MALCLFYDQDQPPSALLEQLDIPSQPDEQKLSSQDVIICWGKALTNNGYRWVLNPRDAVEHSTNRASVHRLLRLSGINTLASAEGVSARYMVPVFHGESLAIFRTQSQSVWSPGSKRKAYREWTSGKSTRLYGKISDLAARAIYTLGLDFGQVIIGKNASGQLCVLHVTAQPRLNRRLAFLYAHAMQRMQRELETELDRSAETMLGTDIEFVLRNDRGQLVPASRFMSKHGRVGHDAIWLRHQRNQFPLVELRPVPATDPLELFRNLYKTMGLAVRKIKDRSLSWLAGALPFGNYPLGGHIHFSRLWRNHFLMRSLDAYLTLPLMLMEDEHSSKRRPQYGFLGDVRDQFHGGFEYRTPPSWILTPQIAKGVLVLVKVIVNHYWELSQAVHFDPDRIQAYYRGDKEALIPYVEALWGNLARTSTYETYRTELESLRSRIFSLQGWKEREDIRRAWKLPPYGKSLPRS